MPITIVAKRKVCLNHPISWHFSPPRENNPRLILESISLDATSLRISPEKEPQRRRTGKSKSCPSLSSSWVWVSRTTGYKWSIKRYKASIIGSLLHPLEILWSDALFYIWYQILDISTNRCHGKISYQVLGTCICIAATAALDLLVKVALNQSLFLKWLILTFPLCLSCLVFLRLSRIVDLYLLMCSSQYCVQTALFFSWHFLWNSSVVIA